MIDIEPARHLLRADGGDLELVGLDAGTAHLRLLLADASCAECVLPRPLLEDVVLKVLRAGEPGLQAVRIDDPRDATGGPA